MDQKVNQENTNMQPAARVGDMHTCPMQMPGTPDSKGFARGDGIETGTCKITFTGN
jgi:uncharacterized Zn-binding protein involved in type VI secretion